MTETYFFDSYAIIEGLGGNKNYKEYLSANLITTNLNLFEVYYKFLRTKGKQAADSFLESFRNSTVPIEIESISQAAIVKLANKQLSMTDVIGFVTAQEHNVKFLTGDKGFRNMKNVEFVV